MKIVENTWGFYISIKPPFVARLSGINQRGSRPSGIGEQEKQSEKQSESDCFLLCFLF